MFSVEGVSFSVGGRKLFDHVTFNVQKDHKIGVVGANGVGKSTLLKLFSLQVSPDSGAIKSAEGVKTLSVSQNIPEGEMTPIDWLRSQDSEYTSLEEIVASGDEQKLEQAIARIADLDEERYELLATIVLSGLGINKSMQSQPVNTLSGGYKMRLNLAMALILNPDILILDEPSNHLDFESVVWLTKYLNNFNGCLIIASHDPYILNQSTNNTLHLDGKSAKLYSGNFASFCEQREQSNSFATRCNDRNEKKIKASQELIDARSKDPKWAGAVSTRKRWVKDAISDLKKLSLDEQAPDITFDEPHDINGQLLTMDNVAVGYEPGKEVLSKINLSIEMGTKITLLGRNGQGKSTFCKLLSGELEASSGTVNRNPRLKVGYFSQDEIDKLENNISLYDFFKSKLGLQRHEDICRAVSQAGYDVGSAPNTLVGEMSGGEKTRLALLLLKKQNPNLLIMDEPSNHLDMQSRALLAQALRDFKGAVILVSHESQLVQFVTQSLCVVKDRSLQSHKGGVDSYIDVLRKNSPLPPDPFVQSKGLHYVHKPSQGKKTQEDAQASVSKNAKGAPKKKNGQRV